VEAREEEREEGISIGRATAAAMLFVVGYAGVITRGGGRMRRFGGSGKLQVGVVVVATNEVAVAMWHKMADCDLCSWLAEC